MIKKLEKCTLSEEEIKFLKSMNTDGTGTIRKFLSKNEIKIANSLVKKEFISKGTSDEKGGSTAFFIEISGKFYLENEYL